MKFNLNKYFVSVIYSFGTVILIAICREILFSFLELDFGRTFNLILLIGLSAGSFWTSYFLLGITSEKQNTKEILIGLVSGLIIIVVFFFLVYITKQIPDKIDVLSGELINLLILMFGICFGSGIFGWLGFRHGLKISSKKSQLTKS